MFKKLSPHYQRLLKIPFLYKFIVIFCGHLALSYIFWNPTCSLDFSSFASSVRNIPDLVSFTLNLPGFLLFSIIFILPFIDVFPEFLFPLLPLAFSSCLYGLGESFLLSSKSVLIQLLGLIFLIMLVFTGFILVALDTVFLCG